MEGKFLVKMNRQGKLVFQVLEQKVRPIWGSDFQASNGVRVICQGFPELHVSRSSDGVINSVYLRGNCYEHDNDICCEWVSSSTELDRVVQALKEWGANNSKTSFENVDMDSDILDLSPVASFKIFSSGDNSSIYYEVLSQDDCIVKYTVENDDIYKVECDDGSGIIVTSCYRPDIVLNVNGMVGKVYVRGVYEDCNCLATLKNVRRNALAEVVRIKKALIQWAGEVTQKFGGLGYDSKTGILTV